MAKQAARTVAPYGLWASPISADLLTQAAISFGDVTVLPAKGKASARIAYVENRPFEQGRSALVLLKVPGAAQDKAPQGEDIITRAHSAQSGVHEYGGGAVAAAPGGESLVFTQAKTCGIFEARPGAEPRRLRDDSKTSRLADFSAHPSLPLVLCVHEDHTVDTPAGVVNTIACLDTRDGKLYTLVKGPDFSVSPRFSPCGRFVAWVSWDHPSMPWWGTQLWVARFLFQDGRPPVVSEARCVAGSPREVAQMPVWAPTAPDEDAALYFTDDETGFANLYEVRVRPEDEDNLRVSDKLALLKVPQESDFQQPAWQLNGSSFVPLNAEWLACSMITRGIHSLALVHLPTRTLRPMKTPFRVISQLRAVDEHRVVFVGTRFDEPSALVLLDVSGVKKGAASPQWQVLKRSSDVVQNGTVPRDYLSQAQTVEFPTTLPDGSKSTAHAIVYPPLNPHYAAPTGAAPPAIILAHGGPTSAADAGLNLGVQFWTTRGFLVCNVNYGGSTGYGRKYMERLNKSWGVVDVRDCAACADWLASGAGAGGPQASIASSAARASRSSSAAGRAQLSLLSERRQPDGTIELTLLNEHAGWSLGAVDFATAALVAGVIAAVQHHRSGAVDFSIVFGIAVAGVLWLWRHVNQVQQETVTSIPDVGIQLTTVKGFAIPWVHARRARLRGPPKTTLPGSRVPTSVAAHFQATSLRTRLIPRDSILDVVTVEAFRRWGVMDYLAISTRAAEGYEGAGRGGKLEVMFPHLLPRLPVVEHVYERLFDRPPPKEATGWDPVRMQKIAVAKEAAAAPIAPANVPRVDPSKIAIAGGSSGGYTVLAALCLYPDSFNAGRSSYGISELTALYRLSHKFESRYPTALLGGTPEEVPQVYHDRSPLYMADRIRAPVIFFQGAEDKVVPPAQSEEIVQAIRKQGGRVSYTLFEGEGHGFRQAAHQKAALEGELQWYIDVLGLAGKE